MLDFVDYGTLRIEFRIKRTKRKTLGISVLPTGEIEVTAPENASIDKIKEILQRRGPWILDQKRLSNFTPPPVTERQFLSGESYYLLGRHLRLKVFESTYDSVDVLNDRIILNCTFPENRELKRASIQKWYFKKANEVLTDRFNFFVEKFSQSEIKLFTKKLNKAWGEYHPSKNSVTLNLELIVAPLECIDYVIIHELSHAICLNHGIEFYNLLTKRLFNWKDLKNELERYSQGLIGLIDL